MQISVLLTLATLKHDCGCVVSVAHSDADQHPVLPEVSTCVLVNHLLGFF